VEAWKFYKTQDSDFSDAQLKELSEKPTRLMLGKSLVGGNATAEIFDGIKPGPIAYVRPRGYEPPEQKLALELGGPWAFYHAFWPAHNIERLADLYSPEAEVAPGEPLWVPLLIRNDTDAPAEVELNSALPDGWSQKPDAVRYPVTAHDFYPIQLTITAPQSQKGTWQTLNWNAAANGKTIGKVALRVYVGGNYLPQ
jgi:hypothetical protein